MSGITMDGYVLVAPEKQTSPEDDMSCEGYVIIPLEKPTESLVKILLQVDITLARNISRSLRINWLSKKLP